MGANAPTVMIPLMYVRHSDKNVESSMKDSALKKKNLETHNMKISAIQPTDLISSPR